MSSGAGSIDLTARRSGARTVLERIRYDGISRCSRAFAHDDAALVVLSQLGPGVVRGDQLMLRGELRAGSHVIVTGQTATRLMGGPIRSHAIARWTVDDGAVLEVVGEPLVAAGDAKHDASTTIDLGHGARAMVSDIVCVPKNAQIGLRTSIRQNGREIFYDAIDAAKLAPFAVGTLVVAGVAADAIATVVGALDSITAARPGYSMGVGQLCHGAFARVVAPDVWTVRLALIEMRLAAREAALRRSSR